MLASRSIRDILLIDRLDIAFEPGLCALTGETGAGKSILLDCLGLALGRRSESGLVRAGAERGTVAASFEIGPEHPARARLADQALPAEDLLVLRRQVGADGKSRAFVNDQPASVATLRLIGDTLIEFQSEREQVALLDPARQRALLDDFAGLDPRLECVRESHRAWRAAERGLNEAEAAQAEAQRDEDFLRHAASELAALDAQGGEEEALSARRTRLMHGEKLSQALERAFGHLGGERSVADRIEAAHRALADVAGLAAGAFGEAEAALERAAIEAREAEAAVAKAARALEHDPASLEATEERLFALRTAARKHRVAVEALPELRRFFERKLEGLEHGAEALSELRHGVELRHAAYMSEAKTLSRARAEAAQALEAAIARELKPLRLGAARFEVAFAPLDQGNESAEGLESVSFLIATNPGSAPAPLERVASGGELSRFLLALKVVLAGKRSASTLVFDEIDQGLGGATAEAVGERLARLACYTQVLVVTHSPQVAARATHHLRVAKSLTRGGALTRLETLDEEARREEIARMLAGRRITEEARAAARRLIDGVGA